MANQYYKISSFNINQKEPQSSPDVVGGYPKGTGNDALQKGVNSANSYVNSISKNGKK
jgi:hypothetical protein